MVDDLV